MGPDENQYRKGQVERGRRAEQATVFLALYIVVLGILFLTRNRETLLKREILILLGIALNISVAAGASIREKWMFAVFAMVAAVAAILALGAQFIVYF